MMFKYAYLLILAAAVILLTWMNVGYKESSVSFDQLFDKIEWEHFRWVNGKYNLIPYSKGGDFSGGVVKIARAGLRGDMSVSTEEARIIFLDCVGDLLMRINTNNEIKPYLLNYPFTPDNIEYSISFDDLKHKTHPPFISNMLTFRENIIYRMLNEQTQKPEIFLRETYQQAIEKAAANRNRGSTTPLPS